MLLRELIRTFFADYLRLVEKESVAGLRLDRITFPQVSAEAGCLVAEVPSLSDGGVVTLLVLIEPEALQPEEVSARISRWLKDFRLCYGEPVLASVVFLQGGRAGVRLEAGALTRFERLDLVRIYFTTFSLSGSRAEYFLERPEPLAWALAALMPPRERTPEEHRRACLERIEAADLELEARALLRRCVEGDGSS